MATIPNFGDLANQQAAANDAATDKTNLANRPNQSGPMGNLTWSMGPNGQWTQTSTLGGGAQGLFDSTLSGQQGLAGTIGGGVNYGNLPAMPDSGFGASQQVIDAWNALQQPGLDKSSNAARARAAAMGITLGSTANNDIERNIGVNESTARNEGILRGTQEYGNVFNRGLQARQQGVTEANSIYDRAIAGSSALGGIRDSLNPNKWLADTPASAAYVPKSIYGAGLDTFSAQQAQENAAQAQSNANRSANMGAINSGISALGGASGIGSLLGGAWSGIQGLWGAGNDIYNGYNADDFFAQGVGNNWGGNWTQGEDFWTGGA